MSRKVLFLLTLAAFVLAVVPLPPASLSHTQPAQATERFGYVTILYSDDMAVAVHVLHSSLVRVGANVGLTCMVTTSVSAGVLDGLKALGIATEFVPELTVDERLKHKGKAVQARYRKNLTKLWVWKLTHLTKVVYLDADTLVIENIDHLFECTAPLCAGLDSPIPDQFNTGILVFRPNQNVFDQLIAEWRHIGVFEDVEQGLLNHFYPLSQFGKEQILPFRYNAFAYADDRNVLETTDDVHVIHFRGLRPWEWWSYPQGDLGYVWRRYYHNLPEFIRTDHVAILQFLIVLPTLVLFGAYQFLSGSRSGKVILMVVTPGWAADVAFPCISFLFEFLGTKVVSLFIPSITSPLLAWAIVYWWGLVSFLLPTILWSSACRSAGQRVGLLGERIDKENFSLRNPFVSFIARWWRLLLLFLMTQPFLALSVSFHFHHNNPDVSITVRNITMFVTVLLPLHLLGAAFAVATPKLCRVVAPRPTKTKYMLV